MLNRSDDKPDLNQQLTVSPVPSPPPVSVTNPAAEPRVQEHSAEPRVQGHSAEPRVQKNSARPSTLPQKPPSPVQPTPVSINPTNNPSPISPTNGVASDLSQQILHELQKRWTNTTSPTFKPQRLYQRVLQRRNKPTNFRTVDTNHLAQCVYLANHIYTDNGRRETIDSLLRGSMKTTWTNAVSKEFGRLAKGNKYGVGFTDIMDFIPRSAVRAGRDITYTTFVPYALL